MGFEKGGRLGSCFTFEFVGGFHVTYPLLLFL